MASSKIHFPNEISFRAFMGSGDKDMLIFWGGAEGMGKAFCLVIFGPVEYVRCRMLPGGMVQCCF